MRKALVALFCTYVAAAQTMMAPDLVAKIPKRMQAFVDQGKTAGIVTLLERHGQIALLSAVGWQDREAKIPMRTDSIFQIMSMTKPVTAVGIMILMEEGRLSIIDPIEAHLPNFKGQPAGAIKIKDLMTHTSGIPSFPAQINKDKWNYSLAESVDSIATLPLQFDPGTKWSYSGSGIATLGRIIEVVSGMPYEQFLAQRIFEPLGMKDTHFFLPVNKRGRLAAVYTDVKGTLTRAENNLYREGAKYPMPEGGLYSTAPDMAKFYQMMLNRGTYMGHRILSPATVEMMTQVHTGDMKVGFAPGFGYGLGWGVIKDVAGTFRLNSIGTYGHGGAYRTYGWVDPKRDMAGVIMQQRTNGGGDVADEFNAIMAMAAAAIVK